MDIKSKIQELVEKIQKDPQLRAAFKENPIKAVETLMGVDLPDDVVNQIVEGVKAKITLDKAGELLGGLKKLF